MTRNIHEEYQEVYEQLRQSGALDLIVAELWKAGVEDPTIPTLEEIIASGILQRCELEVRAIRMVYPQR